MINIEHCIHKQPFHYEKKNETKFTRVTKIPFLNLQLYRNLLYYLHCLILFKIHLEHLYCMPHRNCTTEN